MDRLENISTSDWTSLRDLFLADWPEHLLAYRLVQHYIEIKEKNPLYKVHIFCLNNDWRDGTIIMFDGFQVQLYTLDVSCRRLERAVDVLPKCVQLRFCSIPKRFVPALLNSLKTSGIAEKDIKTYITHMYWIQKEVAAKYDFVINDGTYLAPVKTEHSKYINSLWPFTFHLPVKNCEFGPHYGVQDGKNPTNPKSSEDFIADMIINSDSLGLYNSDHELMSWVLLLHNDALSALQTDSKHLRKGYGATMIKSMSKHLALNGKDTFAFIDEENTPSLNLFNKLGFQEIGPTYWIHTKQTDSQTDLLELKRLYDWD